MKRTTEYQANDGTRFATAEECKRHEQDRSFECLANMTAEQVKAAINRTHIEGIGANAIELADAIEFAGKLIGDKRRAMGGAKRKKKTVAEKHVEGAATIAAAKADEKADKKAKKQ